MQNSRVTSFLDKRSVQGVALGAGAFLLGCLLWGSGALDAWEAEVWSWRVRVFAKPGAATPRIKLIVIDQNSLDWGKNVNQWAWSWPREVQAAIVSFCGRAGVRSLALDMLYTEPSAYYTADDKALGAAMAEQGAVVAACFLGEEIGEFTRWPSGVGVAGAEIEALDEWLTGARIGHLSFPRASFPIPEVATNAAWLANVSVQPDSDGIYGRIPLFALFDGRVVPGLGLAACLVAAPARKMSIGEGRFEVGAARVPVDGAGRAILRFRGPAGTHERISAAQIIQSEIRLRNGDRPVVDPARLSDCYVFLGVTAPGLYDFKPTPMGKVYPGVEIQATVLDNLLSGDFLRNLPVRAVIALMAALGLTAGLLGRLSRGGLQAALAFVVLTPVPFAIGFAGYPLGFWIPVIAPSFCVTVALIAAMIVNYSVEGRQRRFIKSAFRRYLSPAVIERLVQNPGYLRLGGEKRELSIFFSDIQGFTSISENMSPEDLTALLNDYLTAMTDIIQDEGGTLDKYEGDAIIAFWNAPLPVADHAVHAVRAAVRCQDRLAELGPEFRARAGRDLWTRIGIHTGSVVVGNLGSHSRFDYTILGDAANLAARLEGVNKQFGCYTLISESTRAQLGPEFQGREISRIAVVGRREPVRVFEPLTVESLARVGATLDRFAAALALYYDGEFQTAHDAFAALAEQDPVAAAYVQRCRALQENPPDSWDGVWTMTAK